MLKIHTLPASGGDTVSDPHTPHTPHVPRTSPLDERLFD